MPHTRIERTAARVILIDPGKRILLLGARDPDDGRVVWVAPGGGLQEGETLEAAAHRELREEIQLAETVDLHGPVWKRYHEFSWDRRLYAQWDYFFSAHLSEEFEVLDAHLGGEEREYYVGNRWMSTDEIESSRDIFAPRGLADLLRPILAGIYPTGPLEIGI